MVRRSAFTLIELIFAIIVIAIVVMSMPMMMKTNEEAIEANIAQEALFASSAKMMQVLSYAWDDHSADSTNPNTYGKVVYVGAGDTHYYRRDANNSLDVNSSYRVGHILADNHRRFHNATSVDANITSTLTSVTTPTALNNVSHLNTSLVNPLPSAVGYKNNYKMDVNVSYISDTVNTVNGVNFFNFAGEGSNILSNLKLIKVTIKNQDNKTITVLRSYSANIGEFDFAKRRF